MAIKVVKGVVGADGHSVTLSGAPGLPPALTFFVTKEDSLHWAFEEVPQGSKMRVTFLHFPQGQPPLGEAKLLNEGNALTSATAGSDRKTEIKGTVNRRSLEGIYDYDVNVVTDGVATSLRCLWPDGTPAEMGGGEKSGKPV